MTRFLTDTLTDIRRGRESWRVFVAFCAPSFALALFTESIQRLG
jgi:hypothetical protein